MYEIKEEFAVMRARPWSKALLGVLCISSFFAEYAIVKDLHGMRTSEFDPFIGALVTVVMTFGATIVFFNKIRIDSNGIWGIMGFGVDPDTAKGICRFVPWEAVQIKVYDFYFMPAVSYDQSKMPVLWSTFLTNWRKGMRLIAKYGMKSIDSEEDRKLIKKYAGIEQ